MVAIDLNELDNHLKLNSYIEGFNLTDKDFEVWKSVSNIYCDNNSSNFANLNRWFLHIKSFDDLSISCRKTSVPTQKENMKTKTGVSLPKANSKSEKTKSFETAAIKGELNPWPDFIQERLDLWDRLKKEADEELARKPSFPIKITLLDDGTVLDGESWKTLPLDIAKSNFPKDMGKIIVSKVNGEVWDLDRPLEKDSKLRFLSFEDNDEAKTVFWHSTAHILGEALERCYGGHLCYGPPIEEGFFYDMYMENGSVSNLDFPAIEGVIKKILKEKQPFERLEMKKEDLLEMFKYNKFKLRILNEKVKTPTTTVYRCGPLIDLCRGPHVRHTGKITEVAVTKNSCAYWEGKSDAESLQRVYGVSFATKGDLKKWKQFQEEAAKRDHRKLGIQQKLYFFNELSPGSCFFTPKGAFIYNNLVQFIREEYIKRNFSEVITPNIYNTRLWQTSGHWEHYAENMFSFEVEKEKYALKPMNCPGHCIIFGHTLRSWRELPMRMADFGVLHRNEYSGALSGLTRVRRFQQDDAHIFCTPEMLKDEIEGCLEFLSSIYSVLGFDFTLKLSTRPEKFMGDPALWDKAENQLEESLKNFGKKYELNEGDGAFYGPKIDITVTDALRRQHQCATIQLDFQLPIRFDLSYVSESGEKKRPVIIHRAILGSVERMIAILTESYGGKWPFWLSPRQVMMVPVSPKQDQYAKEVKNKLHLLGYQVEADTDPSNTLPKKIRNAQLDQFNFIFVVGQNEVENGTVNVRTRDNKIRGEHKIDDVVVKLKELASSRTMNWEDSF